MGASRTWSVRSSSFGQDYQIMGDSLAFAIRDGLPRIVRDVFGSKSRGHRVISLKARYEPDILDGVGGVELTLETRDPAVPADYDNQAHVTWIHAAFADLPKPLDFPVLN